MEALRACYADSSSDSEDDSSLPMPLFIPLASKKQVAWFLRRVSALVPGLNVVDVDVPLNIICKDDQKLEQVALGREFHVSLGRTVPITRHQIDTIAPMLRQKLQNHKGYSIDFSKWEVFVNDDQTRSFVSLEVVKGGFAEITRQIEVVNKVYKLHNLPEFYKNPPTYITRLRIRRHEQFAKESC